MWIFSSGKRNFLVKFIIILIFLLIFCHPVSAQNDNGGAEILKAYTDFIILFNPELQRTEAEKIARSIIYYSKEYKICDARLVVAVILNESRFRTHAVSSAGAMGLGQLMPETASSLGISDPFEPVGNIKATVRMLRLNLDRFAYLPYQKQVENALAAYNAGYGAVMKYGGIPPYPETISYVYNVIVTWRRICGLK